MTARNPLGKRLIPHIIDDFAQNEPNREAFQIPRSANVQDGWRAVTFKEFANAVNHAAHRITEICGKPERGTFPTIAYIGPNDARYVVMMVGAIKAGYKALFISPRNSQEGQLNLFEKTDCHVIVAPKSHHNNIQPWLHEREMQAVEVGEMAKWFPEKEVPLFPYDKTYEEAEWDPVVVLHTSGSTGLPKPVVARVGMMSIGDAYRELPEFQGSKFHFNAWTDAAKSTFIPMPMFHAAGLYSFINISLYRASPIFFSVDRPLSSDLVVETLQKIDAEAIFLPPAILEDMSQDETCVKVLAKLNFIVFGGGNLAREAGNRLVKAGAPLANMIAATEAIPWPYFYQKNPDLWQYFIINSDLMGYDWRATSEEDVFEQVVVRKDKHPGLQGFFYTFPDDDEYFTKDLYKPHPTLPNHWIYYGRADNIIVFSNGEKLNPVTIEEIISDHPQVQGAVVVGTNKFQPALIVEPTAYPKNADEEKKFIDSIWPLVVNANKETVAHGQIGRQFIMLTQPEKPFPRAGKGTIQRAGAVKLYKDEIDEFYERVGQVSAAEAPRLDVGSEEALVSSIEKLFETHLQSPHLEPDTDFFSAGIDSMQVINASRLLRAGLEAAGFHTDGTSLATRVIYGNPTPRRLAQYLMATLISGNGKDSANEDIEQQRVMKQLHDKYTRHLQAGKPGRAEASDDNQVVLLTGSTGMLGSYLLDQMSRDPKVKKVVCLNRAEDGGVKQQARAMKERGLDETYGGGKAEFHHVDISRSDFGLPRDVYQRLLAEADRFIHNAWPVNFNITVETFEPHLRGVRHVADFATRADKRVAVVFISSIGTADRWDASRGPVPERRIDEVDLASGGYGRSKMVGAFILEDAAKVGDFPAANIRVGQIAGPEAEAGAWNRQEWFPSIVASSLHLKALPRDLGIMNQVDWTPVERIAGLVLEVLGVAQQNRPEDISGYYHGVNPSHTTWPELAPAVQEFYGKDRLPELVSFKEWVGRLEKTQAEDMSSMDSNPGIKLLDSYQGMAQAAEAGHAPVTFAMERTTKQSPSMRSAKAVSPELLKHWCKQWGFA
ncbi:putative NRPS-like protein biosynthetic cluster [Pestalotiopsis sp. 9143b]|nr:putative NRPS-like protein biosynthetic cluster [Pestalotiopsis sp. 9143b]